MSSAVTEHRSVNHLTVQHCAGLTSQQTTGFTIILAAWALLYWSGIIMIGCSVLTLNTLRPSSLQGSVWLHQEAQTKPVIDNESECVGRSLVPCVDRLMLPAPLACYIAVKWFKRVSFNWKVGTRASWQQASALLKCPWATYSVCECHSAADPDVNISVEEGDCRDVF